MGGSFVIGNLYERPTGPYRRGWFSSVSLQTIETVANEIYARSISDIQVTFGGSGPFVTNVYVSIDGASGHFSFG